ncbi:helix-turn-helix transcriptional regulator [Chitinophaga sp. HK235]|uniref:ArsR/SmtB family transcription factor n=1 Tax=Chitinophaga sp. HK235 TaxID=2952571 RepID=UPI001BA7735F|nr:metalloregulator ArsR/SmtB family transcription factor [Chitinophaga sp. HK235]
MEKRRDIYQAIADPTRREIITLIARQSMNLNAIAENFDTSRPGISQHIKILTECGLISIRKQGRERYCELKMDRLQEISGWVEECRKYWNETIDSMEQYLEDLQSKNKKHGKQNK